MGGVKQEDAKKTRLAAAAELLATHLREVGQMTWRRPALRRPDARKVVVDFLRGKEGVKETDLVPNGWRFFHKHFADRMTVTPTVAGGRRVVFSAPWRRQKFQKTKAKRARRSTSCETRPENAWAAAAAAADGATELGSRSPG